jgi:hypothetical protein
MTKWPIAATQRRTPLSKSALVKVLYSCSDTMPMSINCCIFILRTDGFITLFMFDPPARLIVWVCAPLSSCDANLGHLVRVTGT